MGSQHKAVGSPSSGGASSHANSDQSMTSSSVTKSRKYKFHPDYAAAVLGGGGAGDRRKRSGAAKSAHQKRHPFEDDDEFWQKKYKLVNYRKKYPQDFDENLFKTLYDWVTNGNKSDYFAGQGENILFKDGGGRMGGAAAKKPGRKDQTPAGAKEGNGRERRAPRRSMSAESVRREAADAEPPWSSQPQPSANRVKLSGRQRQRVGGSTRRSSSMNVIKK